MFVVSSIFGLCRKVVFTHLGVARRLPWLLITVATLSAFGCGSSVTPADGDVPLTDGDHESSAADVAVVDAAVEVVGPISRVHVWRYTSMAMGDSTEIRAHLYYPGSDVVESVVEGCTHRRVVRSRWIQHENVRWSVRGVERSLAEIGDRGARLDVVMGADQPNPGDIVDVWSVDGTEFPIFRMSGEFPPVLQVRSPSGTPTVFRISNGEAVAFQWTVPTQPGLSAMVEVSWGETDTVFCLVPAARGQYTMPAAVTEILRGALAQNPMASIRIARARVELAGNRPVYFWLSNGRTLFSLE